MISRFYPGQKVLIGSGVIHATVEEVIHARGMSAPLYLVEWWQDGELRGRRLHEADLSVLEGG